MHKLILILLLLSIPSLASARGFLFLYDNNNKNQQVIIVPQGPIDTYTGSQEYWEDQNTILRLKQKYKVLEGLNCKERGLKLNEMRDKKKPESYLKEQELKCIEARDTDSKRKAYYSESQSMEHRAREKCKDVYDNAWFYKAARLKRECMQENYYSQLPALKEKYFP